MYKYITTLFIGLSVRNTAPPTSIKRSHSLNTFKYKLRSYYLNQ